MADPVDFKRFKVIIFSRICIRELTNKTVWVQAMEIGVPDINGPNLINKIDATSARIFELAQFSITISKRPNSPT